MLWRILFVTWRILFVTWTPVFRSRTSNGPFSSVSKPILTTKYAFESSWRDLQFPQSSCDLHCQNRTCLNHYFEFFWIFVRVKKKSDEEYKNLQTFENLGREKNVEIVDLVKSFPTRIWSSKSPLIQRRTDRLKFEIEKRGSRWRITEFVRWRIELVAT